MLQASETFVKLWGEKRSTRERKEVTERKEKGVQVCVKCADELL